LIDTVSNHRTPLIEKFRGNCVWSPKENYALAFKKGDWWSVRIPDGFMTNLTSTIGVKFANELNDLPAEPGHMAMPAGPAMEPACALRHVRRLVRGGRWKVGAPLDQGPRTETSVPRDDARWPWRRWPRSRRPPAAAAPEEEQEEERGIDPAKPLYLRAEHQETRDTGIFKLANLNGSATSEKLIYGPKSYRLAGKARTPT